MPRSTAASGGWARTGGGGGADRRPPEADARPGAEGEPLGSTGDDGDGGGHGRLYVVATPIGNLGDVTLRALEVLRSVPLVAAEDTRLTRRLFERHGIATHLVSFHARNAVARLPALIEHLRSGADLAIVTDAGTPSVSDPGEELVAAWVAEGGAVVPIPGPSAVMAAVVGSGISGPRWSFEGFLPRSGRERSARLSRIGADDRATVLFEAPGRVAKTLADLAATCGEKRPAALCRELTKLHEEFRRGSLGELAAAASDGRLTLRGEFVIVVGSVAAGADGRRAARGATHLGGGGVTAPEVDLDEALDDVEQLVAEGRRRGEAVRLVADATGLPRRLLYGSSGPKER